MMNTFAAAVLVVGALFATGAIAGDAADKPWFVGVADKPKGPMSAAAVEKLIEKGELDGATLAWQDGMADWKPLSEIARFRALVVTPPPLPKVAAPPPLPTKTATTTNPQGKPPRMPSMPPLVMTPPPLPATPPAARRVIGATNTTASPPSTKKIKLIVAAPDDSRAWAEQRLSECNLTAGAVGVVRVIRGVVSVSTTPANACVSRVLGAAFMGAGLGDEEPLEILVD